MVPVFPGNYRDLGRSAEAQSVFASNNFFWLKAGYFTAPAETKPLLHTWSLSVEEQLYLCIPLLLWLSSRRGERARTGILLALLFASFLLSAWSALAHPEAAFYLPHSRGWELLMGCVIAMAGRRPSTGAQPRPWTSELLSGAGLAAILAAVVLYTNRTPFPGIAALLPCGGAAAIIHANAARSTLVGRLLARRGLVWIGLISYSLYLWHWPMLAFARYASIEPLTTVSALCIVAASVPVAWLSYRFIETPFRRAPFFRRPAVVLPRAGAALACLLACGWLISWTDGAAGRSEFRSTAFDEDMKEVERGAHCEPVRSATVDPAAICRLGQISNTRPKVLLVGDSFAGMYLESRERLSERFDCEVWYMKEQNAPLQPDILGAIATGEISDVVLAYSWHRALQAGIPELARRAAPDGEASPLAKIYSDWTMRLGYDPLGAIGDTRQPFRSDLTALVRELTDKGIRVFIVDAPPFYPVSVPLKLGLIAKRGGDPSRWGTKMSEHLAELAFIHDVFRELESAFKVRIIRPADTLCDPTGFCRTWENGHSLYSDDAHLSKYGARLMEPILEPVFTRAPPRSVAAHTGPNSDILPFLP